MLLQSKCTTASVKYSCLVIANPLPPFSLFSFPHHSSKWDLLARHRICAREWWETSANQSESKIWDFENAISPVFARLPATLCHRICHNKGRPPRLPLGRCGCLKVRKQGKTGGAYLPGRRHTELISVRNLPNTQGHPRAPVFQSWTEWNILLLFRVNLFS